MKLTLKITFSAQVLREQVAWLIPGGDLAGWLSAIGSNGQSLNKIELRVLPRSRSDLSPMGVLVTGLDGASPPCPEAQPYGRVGQGLYLPTHAKLEPQVLDDEVDALLSTPSAVFHPVVGLVGFGADEVLSPLSLLRPADCRVTEWTMPEPIPQVTPRVVAIEPSNPLTPENLDEHLRDDIGGQPLKDLPPATGEAPPPNAIERVKRGAVGGFAGALHWFTSKLPESESGSAWLRSIHDWASARRPSEERADQEQRNREIARLLDMLKNSPLQGLSHAIPLSGLSNARGRAAPTNRLGTNRIGFSLSGMFGSGPADPWDIERHQRLALSKSYRAMAVKEASEGRYRRAAYIYGMLLGDVEASARVLEEGGHYEEAALLYRNKLGQPLAAAACYERGGRLGEAASLFLESNEWLRAADIYQRMGQTDEARHWFVHAAEQKTEIRDYLGAASIYEEKLNDVDQAEAVLLKGTASQFKTDCLAGFFDLAARHGRHARAQAELHNFVMRPTHIEEAGTLARGLASARSDYPDQAVCNDLEDAVLHLAGLFMPGKEDGSAVEPLAQAVAALAPQDRLLSRDSRRYVQQLRSSKKALSTNKTQGRVARSKIDLIATPSSTTVHLPTGNWFRAMRIEDDVFALGVLDPSKKRSKDRGLVIARVKSSGEAERKVYTTKLSESVSAEPQENAEQVFAEVVPANQKNRHQILVVWRDQPPLKNRHCSMGAAPPMVLAGQPEPWPTQTLAAAGGNPGQAWVLAGTLADLPELVLNSYREGKLVDSINVQLPADAIEHLMQSGAQPHVSLHARQEKIILTVGPVMLSYQNGELLRWEILTAPVVSIAGAATFSRSRFMLLHEHGLTIVWDYPGNQRQRYIDGDWVEPVAGFTRVNGLLVVADRTRGKLYSTSKGELKLIDQFEFDQPLLQGKPVEVIPENMSDNFALLFANGMLQKWTIHSPSGGRH